jgi:hypothetical protein
MDPADGCGAAREGFLRRLAAAFLAGGALALAARLAMLEGLWSLERERPLVLRWVESLAEHPRRTWLGFSLLALALLRARPADGMPPGARGPAPDARWSAARRHPPP